MSEKEILSAGMRVSLSGGIKKIADVVGVTMGPQGRTVIIESSFGGPKVTKDGVTVARSAPDGVGAEKLGVQLIKDVASKMADQAGDGTTTVVVFANALVHEVGKALGANIRCDHLEEGIDRAVTVANKVLDDICVPVKGSYERIRQVAIVSANHDEVIGDMIADAVRAIGEDGVITVEEAKSVDTGLDVVQGMEFDRGYLSPYFVTNQEKQVCELDNPFVLIHEKKISSLQHMIPILEEVGKRGGSLLIIAEDVEGEALATLVINKLHGRLRVAAVKAPGFGDRRKDMLADIAIMTGGQVISEDVGYKLEKVTPDMLGRARSVKITKDSTIIIESDAPGIKAAVASRCAQIKRHLEEDTNMSDYEKGKLRERLAKLSGGVAIIRVGGSLEAEVRERKDRVEDATHATRSAIDEGIVPGGGVAFLRCSEKIMEERKRLQSEGVPLEILYGMDCVAVALKAPIRRILLNGGLDDDGVIINKIQQEKDVAYGYDARKNVFVNMIEAGIIDPKKTARLAIEYGCSVSRSVAKSDAAIVDKPEEKKNAPAGAHGGMGNGMGMDY